MRAIGRRRWKKASGYHRQARVENVFFRYKSIIVDGLRARSPAGQGTEAVPACNILNQMTHVAGLRRTPLGDDGPVGWDLYGLAPIHARTPRNGETGVEPPQISLTSCAS